MRRKRLRSGGKEVWSEFVLETVVKMLTARDAFAALARVCKSFRTHVVFNSKIEAVCTNYQGRNKAQVCELKSSVAVCGFPNLKKLELTDGAFQITKCPQLTDLTITSCRPNFRMDSAQNLRSLTQELPIWHSHGMGFLKLDELCNLEECNVQSFMVSAADAMKHKHLQKLKCERLWFDLNSEKSTTLSSLSCGPFSFFLLDEAVYSLWLAMAAPVKFHHLACRMEAVPNRMLETPDLMVAVPCTFVKPDGPSVVHVFEDAHVFYLANRPLDPGVRYEELEF